MLLGTVIELKRINMAFGATQLWEGIPNFFLLFH